LPDVRTCEGANTPKLVDFHKFEEIPECQLCHKDYKVFRRFFKATRTLTGGYLFNFASPEGGYVNGEEIHPSKTDLEKMGIGEDLNPTTALLEKRLSTRIFDDEENPDVRVRWRRLRSFLTKRYKHPEPIGNNPCPNAAKDGEKYKTIGIPPTIFQWAEPLFVAMYGLGLSYREILSSDLLPLGKQTAVYGSVRRQVGEYMDAVQDAEKEELLILHHQNKSRYDCAWHYPLATGGMEWQVSIQPKLGEMDQRTAHWLHELAETHKEYLEFHLTKSEIEGSAMQPNRNTQFATFLADKVHIK
jgi:hypothetical protein